MNSSVNLNALKENLSKVKDESHLFSSPDFGLDRESRGVQYLYEKALLPILKNKNIISDDLDFDCFEQEDVCAIFNFFCDNYTTYSEPLSKLRKLFEGCSNSKPKCRSISFL